MPGISISQPMFLIVIEPEEKRGILFRLGALEQMPVQGQSICAGEGGATRASNAATRLLVP